MTERPYNADDLELLRQWDTPTICNGLELIVPDRRALGFTIEPVVAANRGLKPIIGLARVGFIRAREAPRAKVTERGDWYDYVTATGLPTIAVLQDLDARHGHGAYWGEVQSAIHKALGCIGCVTNGSFRDVDMLAPDFQILGGSIGPSHAHVHMVDFGKPVDVLGMHVVHDDVIHADYHGAVVVPADAVRKLPDAIHLVSRREKVILDVVRAADFTPDKLRAALQRAGEIH